MQRPLHARTTNKTIIDMIILLCMALSLVWTTLPLVGWSHYSFEGLGISCSVEWNERSFSVISYNIVILVINFLLPLNCILYADISLIYMVSDRVHVYLNVN